MGRLKQPKFKRTIDIIGSDLVKSVEYDPKTWILDATLKTGERYRYRGVPDGAFAQLVTSNSAGKAFNDHIKRDYWGQERKAYRLRS